MQVIIKYSAFCDNLALRDSVRCLYATSFPKEERRCFNELFQLCDDKTVPFAVATALCDGDFAGFITLWKFDKFLYIEHFAVVESMRGCGIGGKILENIIAKYREQPIVLEVEIPSNNLARRRIGFYEKYGFNIWESVDYVQPPYEADGQNVPMKLMSRNIPTPSFLHDCVAVMYRNVYGVE